MLGKEKCKALKEIRRKIAEENDIEYAVSECTHKGDCKGTCPKCEAELRYLEKELEKRQNIGKKVAVAGVSVGMAAAITGCAPAAAQFMVSPVNFFLNDSGYCSGGSGGMQQLSGDTAIELEGVAEPESDEIEQLEGEATIAPDDEDYEEASDEGIDASEEATEQVLDAGNELRMRELMPQRKRQRSLSWQEMWNIFRMKNNRVRNSEKEL